MSLFKGVEVGRVSRHFWGGRNHYQKIGWSGIPGRLLSQTEGGSEAQDALPNKDGVMT